MLQGVSKSESRHGSFAGLRGIYKHRKPYARHSNYQTVCCLRIKLYCCLLLIQRLDVSPTVGLVSLWVLSMCSGSLCCRMMTAEGHAQSGFREDSVQWILLFVLRWAYFCPTRLLAMDCASRACPTIEGPNALSRPDLRLTTPDGWLYVLWRTEFMITSRNLAQR